MDFVEEIEGEVEGNKVEDSFFLFFVHVINSPNIFFKNKNNS
jgi:hypothetical protein